MSEDDVIDVDDVVRLVHPIANYPDPLGHVRTIHGDPDEPSAVAYVERDDGAGTEPFLLRELETVDVAEFERLNAPWDCRCGRRRIDVAHVVCPKCGRLNPSAA